MIRINRGVRVMAGLTFASMFFVRDQLRVGRRCDGEYRSAHDGEQYAQGLHRAHVSSDLG